MEPATGGDGCDGEVVEFDRQYPEKKQRYTAESHADRHLVDRTAPDRTRHAHRQSCYRKLVAHGDNRIRPSLTWTGYVRTDPISLVAHVPVSNEKTY